MTEITVDISGLTEVMVHLDGLDAEIRRSIGAVVYGQALRVQEIVKDQKLQGGVLNKRTGRLRDSIHVETVDIDGAVVATVGTDVVYAAYHEYGYHGTEQIREHLRHMTMAYGRQVKTPRDILVRAHTRTVDYPARSFLRSTLTEEAPAIRAALETAVQQGLNA